MKIAVLGSTGYTGSLLLRLLIEHPATQTIIPVSTSNAGMSVLDSDPGISGKSMERLYARGLYCTREQAIEAQPDVVFSALPPGQSAGFCEPFFAKSVVFDLSADFRIKEIALHESVYGKPAPFPDLRTKAVYGLAEIYREQIRNSDIIAVPGCYPTCILLPLLPLAQANLIKGTIIANALSGISGAGKTPKIDSLFVERSESAVAYNPGTKHRHLPEMMENLQWAGCKSPLFFTPHLIPMRRGMLATITVEAGNMDDLQVQKIFQSAYRDSPFVTLRKNAIPDTRDVYGSNRCDIGWDFFESAGKRMLYIYSVIDNLMKGAAGQAVQDMNIRFGWEETAGLPERGQV